MTSTLIRLKRRRAYEDSLRTYKILIDGRVVGTIRQSENRSFEVEPGYHEVWLTIDWCSSLHLPLNLAAGEEVSLICQGKNALLAIYNVTFGFLNYIKLYREKW